MDEFYKKVKSKENEMSEKEIITIIYENEGKFIEDTYYSK